MRLDPLETRLCLSGLVAGSVQSIYRSSTVGQYNSIAVNPVTQQPAVAFYDATHRRLDFADYNGSFWQFDPITSGNSGRYTSLKIDAKGDPWIAFYNQGTGDLQVATHGPHAQDWTIQTVDSVGDVGRYASLALTKAGLPVIAYQGDGGTLKLATDTKTGFSIQTVASGSAAPIANISLALDGHDRPRIAYQAAKIEYADDLLITNVSYATFNGKTWGTSLVDNGPFGGGTGYGIDLVLDKAGHPHISYSSPETFGGTEYGDDPEMTHYAEDLGQGWTFQSTIANKLGAGSLSADDSVHTALLLKADGDPLIAYSRYNDSGTDGAPVLTKDSLVLANFSKGSFSDKYAGASTNVGSFISMAENAAGTVYLTYFDPINADLKVFTFPI